MITLDTISKDCHSIKIQDSNGDELGINADGSINISDGGNSLTVDATDLDIRDLVNTQDSIAIGDETNLVDLEISDAAFVGGYGFSSYGVRRDADTSPVSADGDAHPLVFNDSGRLKVTSDLSAACNDSFVISKVAVDDTAGGTQLKATSLASRKEVVIQNLGASDIYIADGTGATVDDMCIPACSSGKFPWGPNIDPYAITAASGSADVRFYECA